MTDMTNIDRNRLLDRLKLMHRIRAFEEAAIAAQKDGLVLGAIHPSIGQEGVAAGVCANLERADLMLSTHRGHGHTLAKGATPLAMMRELMGRDGGTCGGKGGSMHIADFGVGMLGANGVVGANIPIATGAAHGLKLKGSNHIVACIFGDGAINRGPFLEGLNWARVFDLAILFVCEDNGFSATTRTATMTGGAGAGARAESIGVPAIEVDGNDLVELDTVARQAISDIRAGKGPMLLHAKTYRITGHTAVDPATYRSSDEVDAQRTNCPIARLEATLKLAGTKESDLHGLRLAAESEMKNIATQASETEWPDSALAYADVQDVGDPQERAF